MKINLGKCKKVRAGGGMDPTFTNLFGGLGLLPSFRKQSAWTYSCLSKLWPWRGSCSYQKASVVGGPTANRSSLRKLVKAPAKGTVCCLLNLFTLVALNWMNWLPNVSIISHCCVGHIAWIAGMSYLGKELWSAPSVGASHLLHLFLFQAYNCSFWQRSLQIWCRPWIQHDLLPSNCTWGHCVAPWNSQCRSVFNGFLLPSFLQEAPGGSCC